MREKLNKKVSPPSKLILYHIYKNFGSRRRSFIFRMIEFVIFESLTGCGRFRMTSPWGYGKERKRRLLNHIALVKEISRQKAPLPFLLPPYFIVILNFTDT
jgi:hypothetical protein